MALAPVPVVTKFEPVSVKVVPPAAGPKLGVTVANVGTGPLDQEKAPARETVWPSGLITVTVLLRAYGLAAVLQVRVLAEVTLTPVQ